MIDFALWEHIKTLTAIDVYYGSANNANAPYFVLYKISDDERPVMQCDEIGESGKALFFVEGFSGGQDGLSTPDYSLQMVENLKRQLAELRGVINFGTTDYRVWYNRTTGSIPIDRGSNEVSFFGAQFTVLLYWETI